MNSGKDFEKAFQESWNKTSYWFIKLQDAVRWGTGDGSKFMPQSPFDSVGFSSPMLFVMELKSTNGSGMSFNPGDPMSKPVNEGTHVMIKGSQIKKLLQSSEKIGVISGLVLNFRPRALKTKNELNETFFVFVDDFITFAKQSGKSSISRDDCREIGITINGELKKVNYKYDIPLFVTKATELLFCKKTSLQETFLLELQDFLNKYKK